MDLDKSLLAVARSMLREGGDDEIAGALSVLLEATGGARCWLVIQENGVHHALISAGSSVATGAPAGARGRRDALIDEAVAARAVARSSSADGVDALAAPCCDDDGVAAVIYMAGHGAAFSDAHASLLQEAGALVAPRVRRFVERARSKNNPPRDALAGFDFEGIVTRHPSMREALELVARAAPTRAPVLILGPTGSGKELLAHALHRNSDRKTGPFVPVHCSAIPAPLLESELFGHVAGAFSGARYDRPGRIAAARSGTLFLDEMGEMPVEFQIKLLRFIQSGEIQRVGHDRSETVDVRIVSATHQDLRSLVREGRFREDLFYRLNVITVNVPPLRERRSDVPELIDHFLEKYAGARALRLSARARELLLGHGYPGNVRELAHIIERACILSSGPVIDVDLLPAEVTQRPSSAPVDAEPLTSASLELARAEAVASVEQDFLRRLMSRAEGNVSRAARDAGMPRSYLQKLLARHKDRLGG